MGKGFYIASFLSLSVLLSACSRDDAEGRTVSHLPPGVYYGDGTESLTNLPPDAVLLRVNGFPFTRHDFEIDQAVYGKMMAFLKDGKMDDGANDIRRLQAVRAPKVLNTVLRRELLNQEARKRGVKASKAAMSARRKELENVLANNPITNNVISIEELAKRMGTECGQYFLSNLEKDAENLELSWLEGGAQLKASDEEIAAGSNRVAKANELTASTNAVLMARLQKALERVKAGEDFAKVGSELSMIEKRESEEWGTYSADDFESTDYPEIGAFLEKNPKPGTVAGPFQCDDGVSIVKVLSVVKGGDDTGVGVASDSTRFKLARISVETFEKHKMFSREEIRKILEDSKRKKFESVFGAKLFAAAVIEFPSGTNLFAVASSSAHPDGAPNAKPDLKEATKTNNNKNENGGNNVK